MLNIESQPVVLSLELLDLSTVAVHSVTRRLVVLHNTSATTPANFTWNPPATLLPSPSQQEPALEVVPASGALAPGEKRACRVTFRPGSVVGFFELDVPCQITYTPPQPSPPARKLDSDVEVLAQSGSIARIRARIPNPEVNPKRTMFPPLAQRTTTINTTTKLQPTPSESTISSSDDISNPVSTTLFLTIQAQTLPAPQFREIHGNYSVIHTSFPTKAPSTPQKVLQKSTSQQLPRLNSQTQLQQPSQLSEEQAMAFQPIASSFLSSLIAEIMADPDLQEEARQHDDNDVIPYFEQLNIDERPPAEAEPEETTDNISETPSDSHELILSTSAKLVGT